MHERCERLPVSPESARKITPVARYRAYFARLAADSHGETRIAAVTFSTTVAPGIRNGLVPVVVDVDLDSYQIDVDNCIYCRACIEVAPRDCIRYTTVTAPTATAPHSR